MSRIVAWSAAIKRLGNTMALLPAMDVKDFLDEVCGKAFSTLVALSSNAKLTKIIGMLVDIVDFKNVCWLA